MTTAAYAYKVSAGSTELGLQTNSNIIFFYLVQELFRKKVLFYSATNTSGVSLKMEALRCLCYNELYEI